jgi:hypothetical protein
VSSGDLALRNPITGIAGCCARAPNGHVAAAPLRSVMNSRRRISAPKLRRQHCIGSNEYFDRGSNRRQNHCRSAQPMSHMGLVSRVTPVHTAVRNCTRDEGRSFEVGLLRDQLGGCTETAQAASGMEGGAKLNLALERNYPSSGATDLGADGAPQI